MSARPADDPSFRVGADQNDSLSVMTRLRAAQAFESNEPTELDGAVDELIDRNLDQERPDWAAVTHKVMRGIVASIADQDDADWAIRRASHRAVLAVARRWGNIVMAGKATVVASQEAASVKGLNSVKAAQQAGLGAIEGVLLVGPVAYPILQREITPIVEDFAEILNEERRSGEWMLRSLERTSIALPVLEREEEPGSSGVDLVEDDYRLDEPPADEPVAQPVQVLVPDYEDYEEELPSAKVPGPPKKGLIQRFLSWVKGLFRRK